MSTHVEQASWILIATFALSIIYEIYRATAKAGVSEHDSTRSFIMLLPFYVLGFGIAFLIRLDEVWSTWVGLISCIVFIAGSIFYYQPNIMLDRKPGPIDWFEDLVFTGLLFPPAFLLAYELLDVTLTP